MSDPISDEQTDAATAVQPRARARRVREIDFSRPSKFTQEQQKRIERAHEAYCRTVTNQLSAELRMPVELEIVNLTEHVWSTALADAPAPCVFGVVGVQPEGGRFLVAVELEGMLRMVVRLLGGPDEAHSGRDELTEIERSLTRRIFTSLIAELSVVWQELLGTELELLGLETALQAVQIVPPSDPSLAITMEARFRDASATIALLVPHRSIANAVEKLASASYDRDAGASEATVAELRASLSDVEVEVRAEVAAVELPIDDVIALKPGDLIRFGVPAAAGVMLYADRVAIHRARPGRSENARAVSVLEHVEQEL